MDLKDRLKQAFLEDLGEVRLLRLGDYVSENQEFIYFMFDKGVLKPEDEELNQTLEKLVLKRARIAYNLIVNSKKEYKLTIFPDHVMVPDALAYGLQNGLFTRREIEEIPFEPGDNLESFLASYKHKDIIAKYRNIFLKAINK